ncbi:selection and upkeep of intraepithelial T-cells protein 7-like [Oreochromis aureus]|uniref:selection and upkeep of intraepithelial T-cells protein 7-like n=1 Tax=Oreochromis aureus TaxID=47969 RepID=UPI001952BA99|nr:selection and upkeep of intraepithelial T-cells protein 7-like [Oreochromis aureus]
MSAVTASLCSTLLFVGLFVFVSADQKNITAESGQKVSLPCRTPNNNTIRLVKWSRNDLKPQHVLLYRDGHFEPANQHPSFKNRVELQDRQMKDGDVSLILKDVTINDTGTYECLFIMSGTKNAPSIIHLSVVDPPGQPGGDTEDGGKEAGGKEAGGHKEAVSVVLIVSLSVSAVLVLVAAVVSYLFYQKQRSVL